ncbi:MAG: aminoacyl-tRNA hydrolase [Lachnospiraceae bacterium]|nr:aminoacyl-tRNA hydrolase [Lachnospiraceae bacterium]
MYIIVGLGNPGKEYEKTKHNTGFRVIDKLAEDYNINTGKFKFRAFMGEGNIKGSKVMLVKPQTFMNLSGESIISYLDFYKTESEKFILVYDDASLPLGAVRIRREGSAGGHNGVKSVINHLGKDVFTRVKVGVGEKPSGWDLADYVLSKFSKDEEPLILLGIDKAAFAVSLIITEGVDSAMNKTNQIER